MFVPGKTSARQLITYGLFFLCAYAAWARGGTYPPLQWPLLIGALLLCFSPFILERDRRLPFLRRVCKDPVFGLGLGLLIIILFQWCNSNYGVVLKESGGAELARTPSKWIPWSVDPGEAGEMLFWFFPVWASMLVIRNLLHRKHVVSLLYLMAVNSALLACIGLVQVVVGTRKVLGIWDQPHEAFFASFGYANHACGWFYLNAFLAAGLAHRALVKGRPKLQVCVWSGIFVLCVVSTFMTLSRLGAFVSVVLLSIFLIIFLRHVLPRYRGSGALNIYIFAGIILLFGAALFLGVGGGALAREVGEKALVGEVSVAGDLKGRIVQIQPAWEMTKDYPVFGAGGWSYRWLTKLYVPVEEWGFWEKAGRANVHCDSVQFLQEFGIIGSLCLGLIVAVLVKSMLQAKRGVLWYWISGGIVVVFLHSFIDLPFRCPAILLAWSCLLAALPRLTASRGGAD